MSRTRVAVISEPGSFFKARVLIGGVLKGPGPGMSPDRHDIHALIAAVYLGNYRDDVRAGICVKAEKSRQGRQAGHVQVYPGGRAPVSAGLDCIRR